MYTVANYTTEDKAILAAGRLPYDRAHMTWQGRAEDICHTAALGNWRANGPRPNVARIAFYERNGITL
jgi:hypothetical protein